MWKINCWLASLSATDTHFNSAVLRWMHVPAHPALWSRHFPPVPSKSGFIVPELEGGTKGCQRSGQGGRGCITPAGQGARTPVRGQDPTLTSALPSRGCPTMHQLSPPRPHPGCAPACPLTPLLPIWGAVLGKRSSVLSRLWRRRFSSPGAPGRSRGQLLLPGQRTCSGPEMGLVGALLSSRGRSGFAP